MRHTFQNLNMDSKQYNQKYKAGVSIKDLTKAFTKSMNDFIGAIKDWESDISNIEDGGNEVQTLLFNLIQENESISHLMDHLKFLSRKTPLAASWDGDVQTIIDYARKEDIEDKRIDRVEKLYKSIKVIADRMRSEKKVIDRFLTNY